MSNCYFFSCYFWTYLFRSIFLFQVLTNYYFIGQNNISKNITNSWCHSGISHTDCVYRSRINAAIGLSGRRVDYRHVVGGARRWNGHKAASRSEGAARDGVRCPVLFPDDSF